MKSACRFCAFTGRRSQQHDNPEVRIHNGPLELRKALPSRDTTEWVGAPEIVSEALLFGTPEARMPSMQGPPNFWPNIFYLLAVAL